MEEAKEMRTWKKVLDARDEVLALSASELTAPDVVDGALDTFEATVREDERSRLIDRGALPVHAIAGAAPPLAHAAADVLAYMEDTNTYLSPDERVQVHFRWREGVRGTKAVDLFARLRRCLQPAQEASPEASQAAGLPSDYLLGKFTCASCTSGFPVVEMEQVHPSNGHGTCKACYKFLWDAGAAKFRKQAERGVRR